MTKSFPDDIGRVERQAATRFDDAPAVRVHEERLRQGASFRRVRMDRIRPNSQQSERRREGVADLAQSILAHGLIHPPILRRVDRGRYEIVAGHRRTEAWQILVLEGKLPAAMPAFVHDHLDDTTVLRLMIAENHHRSEPDVIHDALTIGRYAVELKERLGRGPTVRELAAEIPPGKSAIQECLVIYRGLQDERLAPLVRQADRLGKSLLSTILSASEFSTTKVALEQAAAGASAQEVREFLEANDPKYRRQKGGRPQKSVVRTSRGDWYDLTLRVRGAMSDDAIEETINAAEAMLADLRALRESRGVVGDSNTQSVES